MIQASKDNAVLLDTFWILKFVSREGLSDVFCAYSCLEDRHGKGSQAFQGMQKGFCRCVHSWFRIKWSGGKRTLRTWSNYNHQKNPAACQVSTGVLLLCQVLLHGSEGVWFLPCSPGLSAFPSPGHTCCHSACFICRLQIQLHFVYSPHLNSLLNLEAFFTF